MVTRSDMSTRRLLTYKRWANFAQLANLCCLFSLMAVGLYVYIVEDSSLAEKENGFLNGADLSPIGKMSRERYADAVRRDRQYLYLQMENIATVLMVLLAMQVFSRFCVEVILHVRGYHVRKVEEDVEKQASAKGGDKDIFSYTKV